MITLLSHEDDGVKAAAALALAVLAESGLSRASIGEWGGIEPLVRMLRPDKVIISPSFFSRLCIRNFIVQLSCIQSCLASLLRKLFQKRLR